MSVADITHTKWEFHSLSSIIELIGGGTPKTSIPEYWNGDIPWLSVNDFVGDSRYVSSTEKHITQAGLDNSSAKLLRKGDIIISARGTVGELAQLSEPMAFNQSCYGIRGISTKIDQAFLYYLLRIVVNDLRKSAHGSVFSTITRSTFESIEVPLPPLINQNRIAKVLGSLDDKIAVNNKIIKLSLKLAKLLPQCVQQEQQKYKLSEISNLISRGITPKYVEDGFTVLNQKCIRNNLVDLNQARQASNLPKNHERILQQYDVLVNSTGYGTLGRISPWLHETAQLKTVITDTHITTIRFDDQKVDPAFAAMVLSTQENAVANLAEGSTGQTELKRELIENFEIMLPPFAIQHEVSQQIRPLLLAVMTLRNENQTLARTRDELLPLLMSGKITVRDAEKASAEVGVDKHEVEE